MARLSDLVQQPKRRASPYCQSSFRLGRVLKNTARPGSGFTSYASNSGDSLTADDERRLEKPESFLPHMLKRAYQQFPAIFKQLPPLDALESRLAPNILPPSLFTMIATFLKSPNKTKEEFDSVILVPWSKIMTSLDYSIDNAWMVVDLLRVTMTDHRVSEWFVEHRTLE